MMYNYTVQGRTSRNFNYSIDYEQINQNKLLLSSSISIILFIQALSLIRAKRLMAMPLVSRLCLCLLSFGHCYYAFMVCLCSKKYFGVAEKALK